MKWNKNSNNRQKQTDKIKDKNKTKIRNEKQKAKKKKKIKADRTCGRRMENTFKQSSRGFPAGFSSSCFLLSLFHTKSIWFQPIPVLKIKGGRSYPQSIKLFSSNSSLFNLRRTEVLRRFWEFVQRFSEASYMPHNLTLPPSSGFSFSWLFHGMKHVTWNKPQRGRLLYVHKCVECILTFLSVCGCV